MENNLTPNQPFQTNQIGQNQVPVPNAPPQVVPPIVQQSQVPIPQQAVPPAHKSNFMRILLIIIAFCLIVIMCIYIYLSFFNKQNTDSSSLKIENSINPTAPVSVKNTDEEELNNIDVGNVDTDLKEVDADLQKL